jgi:hypothetical protein
VKLARSLVLLLVLTFTFTGQKLHSAETVVNLPVQTRSGLVTIGLGLDTTSSSFTVPQNEGATTFTIDDYKVQITETATKQQSIVRVQIERGFGLSFTMNSLSFKLQVPGTFAGIWYPGSDVNSSTMMSADAQHSFATMSDANFGIPFVAAVTSTGKNALAVGMGHQDLSVAVPHQLTIL